ncbi:FKBP12-rapamycin complex-associated protein [Fasciola gigantica]|uniref:FKBP12-rapamycin complex-associated protein n=1 Tax=Fasciola gigantica TaxID=46835 RepID=A0A504YC96_FASGI|nr:FKBP12-rapamycin complex-associated protein [Fasciola gigantica]
MQLSPILVLRELVLNTPTSFYQQFGPFVCAIMSAFRDKNATTRELASITLRSAFELAAAREQRSRMGAPVGGNNRFGGTDIVRGLEFLGAGLQDPSESFGFNRPNYGQHGTMRNPLTQDHSVTSLPRGTPSNFSAPIDWYRNCLIEALRAFPAPGTSSSGDQNVTLKKLHRDDWTHGSMLLLTELLICVQSAYDELLNELDEMVGVVGEPNFPCFFSDF